MKNIVKILLIICFAVPELALSAGNGAAIVKVPTPQGVTQQMYSINFQKKSSRRSSSRRSRHRSRNSRKAKGSDWIRNWGKDVGWGKIRF